MRSLNLDRFFYVTTPNLTFVFLDEDEASRFTIERNNQLQAEFEAWERGESIMSSGLVDSYLESDGFGGCEICHRVRPDLWVGYDVAEVHTKKLEHWKCAKGFSSVRWGDPTFTRPSKGK
jgi:hypothetical protein